MVILGLDPGTIATGFGLIQKQKGQIQVLNYGIIPFEKSKVHNVNLIHLEQNLKQIIKDYKPSLAAVEKLFFFKNKKTALQVAEARGVIMLTLEKSGIENIELTPLETKQSITGYGQATKNQVQFMVRKLTDLKENPRPDDAADALALAICAAERYRFKALTLNNIRI